MPMRFPPIRVLLIEDNPGDARLVKETLKEARGARFEVEWFDRLSKGIDRIEQGGIDLVLLDLLLPDSYGFDTLDWFHDHARHVPIVVLTGVEDESFALEAVKRGAQDYLLKGHIDAHQGDALVRCLRYAVDRHRNLRELEEQRERLRAIKAQLHDLLELSTDGVVIVGQDGLVRFVNSAAEKLLGRISEDLQGEPFPHPIPSDRPVVIEFDRREGGHAVAELRAAPTEWDGEEVRFLTMRDLTERPPGRATKGPSPKAPIAGRP
jgi:DNA-binding NarL/FixJ family response regulator